MDARVLGMAKGLQERLQHLDSKTDRDTLVWAHGFLTGVIRNIESRLPDLVDLKNLLQSLRAMIDKIDPGCESDSSDEAPVTADLKPGPKGLRGGAALELPETDRPM